MLWRAGRHAGFEGISRIGGLGLVLRYSGNSGEQCVPRPAPAIICEGSGCHSENGQKESVVQVRVLRTEDGAMVGRVKREV